MRLQPNTFFLSAIHPSVYFSLSFHEEREIPTPSPRETTLLGEAKEATRRIERRRGDIHEFVYFESVCRV